MRTNELTGIFFHFIRTEVTKATLPVHSERIATLGPKFFISIAITENHNLAEYSIRS